MNDLGTRLQNLLGKSDTDNAFNQVIDLVGSATNSYESGGHRTYQFNELGFVLTCHKDHFFWGLQFHFGTKGVLDKKIRPYSHDLPFGIKATDSRLEIEHKLKIKPSLVQENTEQPLPGETCCTPFRVEKYELDPFHYTFIFDPLSGALLMLAINRFHRQ